MRILVCGIPDWTDWQSLKDVLDGAGATAVIHNGSGVGVDGAAAEYATERGIEQVVHPIDIVRHGAQAEQQSVQAMLDDAPDLVMCFVIANLDDPNDLTPVLTSQLAFEDGRYEIQTWGINPNVTPAEGAPPDAPPDPADVLDPDPNRPPILWEEEQAV